MELHFPCYNVGKGAFNVLKVLSDSLAQMGLDKIYTRVPGSCNTALEGAAARSSVAVTCFG
jgi:hypothetical protein